MSDTGAEAPAASAAGAGPIFTEREMQMLAWAMQSLKSGPPDVDYDQLAKYAGMSNPRSAANAWAKIRNKLKTATVDGATPATPKKGGAKKKAAAKSDDGDAEAGDGETPKKTPRKRAAKKQEVEGESSPKKKGRPTKGKKEPANEAADIKAEAKAEDSSDSRDLQPKVEDTVDAEDEV